jgi:hypothetical protein
VATDRGMLRKERVRGPYRKTARTARGYAHDGRCRALCSGTIQVRNIDALAGPFHPRSAACEATNLSVVVHVFWCSLGTNPWIVARHVGAECRRADGNGTCSKRKSRTKGII